MKTIYLDNRILLIDEDKNNIKSGNLILVNSNTYCNAICEYRESPCPPPYVCNKDISYKIVAAYPKIEDVNVYEFKILPPNTESDIVKLALDFVNTPIPNHTKQDYDTEIWISGARQNGFIAGYKQAKSETMFSVDDMRKCWNYAGDFFNEYTIDDTLEMNFGEFIQSITKPKEYEFVVEMIDVDYSTVKQPKIINNKIYGFWKEI